MIQKNKYGEFNKTELLNNLKPLENEDLSFDSESPYIKSAIIVEHADTYVELIYKFDSAFINGVYKWMKSKMLSVGFNHANNDFVINLPVFITEDRDTISAIFRVTTEKQIEEDILNMSVK